MVQEEVFQAIGWHGSQQLVQHIWEQHVEKCISVLKIANCAGASVRTQSETVRWPSHKQREQMPSFSGHTLTSRLSGVSTFSEI